LRLLPPEVRVWFIIVTMPSAATIRPRWWQAAVLLLEIVLPGFLAVAGMLDPIPTFLGIHRDDLTHYCPDINELFKSKYNDNDKNYDSLFALNVADELRGQACGTALATVVAIAMLHTPHFEVLWVTNILVLCYLLLLLINYVAMWIASNFFDTMGIAMIPPTMVLHSYMLRKMYYVRKEEEQQQTQAIAKAATRPTTEETRLLA